MTAVPPFNPSRITTFDFARGLAILFMMLIHVLDFYGQSVVRDSLFGHFITFAGSPPAAPVFMFIMGMFIALSTRVTLATGLKRAAWLFILGYALNLFRGSLPMWLSLQMGLVTTEQLGGLSPLTELLIVDILQFAGLAFAICVIVKHALPTPRYWLALGVIVLFISPFLYDISTGKAGMDELLKLLWGNKEQGAMFPLFPWLVYPLFGMVMGSLFKQTDNQTKLIGKAGLVGLVLIISGTFLTLTDVEFHYGYYLRSGPGATIWIIGFVLCWLWICDLLMKTLPANNAVNRLFFWSRHVTVIYVVQWLIIGWGLMFVGVQQLNFSQTLLAMLMVITLSDWCLRAWVKLTEQNPSASQES